MRGDSFACAFVHLNFVDHLRTRTPIRRIAAVDDMAELTLIELIEGGKMKQYKNSVPSDEDKKSEHFSA